jgi:thiamine biosynthesis lipoprotein
MNLAGNILSSAGMPSGSVNAGGDLRVFGSEAQTIQIRNPSNPHELINLGNMFEGESATSSLYFAQRDHTLISHLVNPPPESRAYCVFRV